MKVCVAALLGVVLILSPVLGQDANLTGVWRRGGDGNSAVYTIDQQDSVLKLAFQSDYRAGTLGAGLRWSQTYTLDGVERYNKASASREEWTTAAWQGPSLVILRVEKDGYHVTVVRECWSISGDGQTLTKSKRTIGMDAVTENTEIFRR